MTWLRYLLFIVQRRPPPPPPSLERGKITSEEPLIQLNHPDASCRYKRSESPSLVIGRVRSMMFKSIDWVMKGNNFCEMTEAMSKTTLKKKSRIDTVILFNQKHTIFKNLRANVSMNQTNSGKSPKFVFPPTFIFCSPICSNNCGVVFL